VCPLGEVGEICVEGPNVMLGYLNIPKVRHARFAMGVLYTGDKGFFDADGYLYISGRADEMVKVAGERYIRWRSKMRWSASKAWKRLRW